jgi:uncharacterized protein
MEAIRRRAGPAHGVLIIAALALVVSGLLPLPWPLYLLLPLVLYAGIVFAIPALRATAPRLAFGRAHGPAIAFAVAVSVGTSAVLITFHLLAHPDVSGFAVSLPIAGPVALVLVGICFSLLNAVLEELIFRGILWEVVAAEWNAAAALVVTAGVFGIFHLHGYPPGPLGVVLACLFGVALGLLRWWTGGLALAVACHVCADATIFGLLAWSGGFN